jgi:hypothetical protein
MIKLNVMVIRVAAQAVGCVVVVRISDSCREEKVTVGKSKYLNIDTGVFFPRWVSWHSL